MKIILKRKRYGEEIKRMDKRKKASRRKVGFVHYDALCINHLSSK